MDKIDLFLKELTELTKKYSIKICGCGGFGCCPWLEDTETSEMIAEDFVFSEKEYKYKVDKESAE